MHIRVYGVVPETPVEIEEQLQRTYKDGLEIKVIWKKAR